MKLVETIHGKDFSFPDGKSVLGYTAKTVCRVYEDKLEEGGLSYQDEINFFHGTKKVGSAFLTNSELTSSYGRGKELLKCYQEHIVRTLLS